MYTTFTLPPVAFQMNPEEIVNYFDLAPKVASLSGSVDAKVALYKSYCDQVKKVAERLPEGSEKENFVYYTNIALKDQIDVMRKELGNEKGLTWISEEEISIGVDLTNRLKDTLKVHRTSLQRFNLWKYLGFDSYEHTDDYRICPHCGLIWYKVQGCLSPTCGKIPSFKDVSSASLSCYEISFENSSFSYRKKKTAGDVAKSYVSSATKTARGCGASLDWKSMTIVPKHLVEGVFYDGLEVKSLPPEAVEQMRKLYDLHYPGQWEKEFPSQQRRIDSALCSFNEVFAGQWC